MAETNTPVRINIEDGLDGEKFTGFPEGVDSYVHPVAVKPTQVRWLENASIQGAFIQTRPGYKTVLEFNHLDPDSAFYAWWMAAGQPIIHPQMMVDFMPSNGVPQKVIAISGTVWFCGINHDGSLGTPQLIPTLHFCENADQLTGTPCTQTSTIISGLYANNITPTNLLVIQDGINRAGIWDGNYGYHGNPEKSVTVDSDGNTLYNTGFNEIPIGLWCAWSGGRLFVYNGRIGRASDEGDPVHFTEEMVLGNFPLQIFPEDVTGAIDRGTSGNNQSAVVVCTRTTTWTIYSGIRDRTQWAQTTGFMTKIFAGVGCVAGKSMILHRGLLYWRSLDGLVLFDSVNTVNSTQYLPVIDLEMAYSKRLVAPPTNPAGDLTCAGGRGSTVFWSMPVGTVTNGRCYPRHTQVLDRQTTLVRTVGVYGPFSYGTTGWQGVWTGIRPVEWSATKVGAEHTYALSMDSDGVVRVWEAFQGNRADNGHRIPWTVETRLDRVQRSLFEYANFRHFRLFLDQIMGNLDLVASWRGMRGRYHQSLNTRITATPGSILSPVPGYDVVGTNTPEYSFAPQTRTLVSPDSRGAITTCSAAGVESKYQDDADHAFSLLLQFTGRGALVAYRIAVDARADNTEGTSDLPTGVDETGFNILSASICPQHIAGVTPDYIAADQPNQLALSPYQPLYDDSSNYQSPQP